MPIAERTPLDATTKPPDDLRHSAAAPSSVLSSPDIEQKICATQVETVYRLAPTGYAFTLLVAALLCMMLSPVIELSALLSWFTLMCFVTALRSGLIYFYRRTCPTTAAARPWGLYYGVSALVGGSVWGLSAVMLFPLANTEYQALHAMVLVGMTAGPITRLAPLRAAALLYLWSVMLPLCVQFLRQPEGVAQLAGIMAVLFTVWMTVIAENHHRMVRQALRWRWQNDALNVELASERNRLAARVEERTENLERLLNFDTLTGLPNYHRMRILLDQALAAMRDPPRPLLLALIDVDHFTLINEGLGHQAGNQLLQSVARRLGKRVPDGGWLARAGGDEFALVLRPSYGHDRAEDVIRRLCDELQPPFSVAGQEIFLSASVGVSRYPDDADSVDTLLQHAAIAQRDAKAHGRNTIRFFRRSSAPTGRQRLALENALRRALTRQDELTIHFQPQAALADGRITGMEALVRWTDPTLGTIPTETLISLAEQCGLISALGEYVLRAACLEAARWHRHGRSDLQVSVNLSARQFLQNDLAEKISAVLTETGLPARALKLEVTESLLMADTARAAATLQTLKDRGVHIAIDDFGTGYSSLSYLGQFPLNCLKIDQSFIRGIGTDPHSAMLVTAIIALAHKLQLAVIAEGVETEVQLAFLRAHQCDEIQGYLLGRPIAADETLSWLSQPRALAGNDADCQGRVLVVDDDAAVVDYLHALLSSAGFLVRCANTGEEALAVLVEKPVDVVLCDYSMPGMDGAQLLNTVQKLHPQIRRIMMSGHNDTRILAEAVNKGTIFRFLLKPLRPDQLHAALDEALRQ